MQKESEQAPGSDRHRLRRARRRAADVIKEIDYPHNIHPALVPGVAIEDQRVRYGIDRRIVLVVGTSIVGFIIWGVLNPANVSEVSGIALDWVTQNLGWVFNLLATGMAIFLLFLAFSRYGRIPLGLDGEKKEYSTISWVAMLFAAGIGIGIIFFGPFESLPRPAPRTLRARHRRGHPGCDGSSRLALGNQRMGDLRDRGTLRRIRLLPPRPGAPDEFGADAPVER